MSPIYHICPYERGAWRKTKITRANPKIRLAERVSRRQWLIFTCERDCDLRLIVVKTRLTIKRDAESFRRGTFDLYINGVLLMTNLLCFCSENFCLNFLYLFDVKNLWQLSKQDWQIEISLKIMVGRSACLNGRLNEKLIFKFHWQVTPLKNYLISGLIWL